MRLYIIKHKGKTTLYNIHTTSKLTFPGGEEIDVGRLFLRKKDAQQYHQHMPYNEFLEVVGVTVDKCDQDNRRK